MFDIADYLLLAIKDKIRQNYFSLIEIYCLGSITGSSTNYLDVFNISQLMDHSINIYHFRVWV
jgi:hypothetical protein